MLSVLTIKVTRASSSTLAVNFPYDEGLVTLVKSIPGRTWDKATRRWLVPANPDTLDMLRTRTPRYAKLLVESGVLADIEDEREKVIAAQAIRAAGDSAIAFDYLTAPYAHQRAGLDFLAKLGSGALLWEMGLGKTKTAIDYAEWLYREGRPGGSQPNAGRILVICPNTVKRNWSAEIEKHAGHKQYVVPEGTLAKRAAAFGTARYTIVNCEQLSYDVTAKALQKIEWDLVIVDESTRFKANSARRTKALHKLNARRRVILTGTPITGKPEDAWSQMEFVAPGTFGSFYAFRDRFLEIGFFKQVEGIKAGREGELAEKIGRRSYRILKADVLDLPPKVYTDRLVTLEGDQATAYQQMKDELRTQIEDKAISAQNILTLLLRLTQITAGLVGSSDTGYLWFKNGAKVTELRNLLNDELAGEQVVIFGQYQKELEHLATEFATLDGMVFPPGLPIIYGPTPEKVRHRLVTEFQAGDRRLLFCQNRTGGIGINLTAAQTAIYVTRSWSLEEWLQSQDRLHRIGQRGTVSIVSLTAAKTVDEEIAKALAEKQNIADHLTGDAARRLAARLLGA